MSQEAKDDRIVLKGQQVRDKILEGAKASYDTVVSSYGPKGRNVILEKPFGRPIITRDGVTIARDTYFEDRAKNVGAQAVLEASETTNRIAGDGTTATVALTYHLLKQGASKIAADVHPMEVKEIILNDSQTILDKLETLTRKTKPSQLKEVATVSSGDPILGQLIAEAIEYVGPEGGIITEKSHVQEIEREYVDGYYLQTGFSALQSGKKELADPIVIVASKRLSSTSDAQHLINKVAELVQVKQSNEMMKLVLIGNIEDAAYNIIVNIISQGLIDAIILKAPPQFGAMGTQLLEDIAVYAGCTPISDTTSLKSITSDYLGTVDKVVASKSEATLFGNNKSETVQDKIDALKGEIEAEPVDAIAEKLRDRLAKLQGKIAIFRIGGVTDTAKEEKEFRVEDAILATRAAYAHGVVPGGGVTLIELSLGVGDLYQNALRDTFKQLLINANLSPDLKLQEILEAPKGTGFNLRTGEKVDMVKEGILDPKLVVEQVITNASDIAANLLTADTMLIFRNKE